MPGPTIKTTVATSGTTTLTLGELKAFAAEEGH